MNRAAKLQQILTEGQIDVTEAMNPSWDSAERDLYDNLMLRASNDGAAYRKKDAAGAVKRAWMDWQKDTSREARENYKTVMKELIADLAARWATGEP